MADHIPVQAARVPDRDRLLEELKKADLDARAVGEVEIEVRTDDEDGVHALVERTIMLIGAPFVPQKHDGVIYIRPPLN